MEAFGILGAIAVVCLLAMMGLFAAAVAGNKFGLGKVGAIAVAILSVAIELGLLFIAFTTDGFGYGDSIESYLGRSFFHIAGMLYFFGPWVAVPFLVAPLFALCPALKKQHPAETSSHYK